MANSTSTSNSNPNSNSLKPNVDENDLMESTSPTYTTSPNSTSLSIIPESFQHSTSNPHSKRRSNPSPLSHSHSLSSPIGPMGIGSAASGSNSIGGMRTPREPEASGHGPGLRGRDDELPSPSSSTLTNFNPIQSSESINSNSNLSLSQTLPPTTSEGGQAQNNLHLLAALAGPSSQPANTSVSASASAASTTPLIPPDARKLCVRHQRMADEGVTARLQKVSSVARCSGSDIHGRRGSAKMQVVRWIGSMH